ncbi:MAG TPA: hypothetical protein G4O16_09410 [Dehalococcoidia bacterium]|nr:hypothetical protein [Dehalococcoidia bacterium]
MRLSTGRGNRALLFRIPSVAIIILILLSFSLFSCGNSELTAEIVGRWDYSFPPGIEGVPDRYYDPEGGLIDAYPVTSAEIDGETYLILGFPSHTGRYSTCYLIFDTEDPFSPQLISMITPEQPGERGVIADSCAVSGNILYSFLFGEKGLWLVDISDPSNPVDLGIVPVEATRNLMVADGIAYASGQFYDGVTIVDVSDIENIREIARIDLTSRDCFLEVCDGYLYVGIGQTLTVYDVSDPACPEMLCNYELNVPEGLVREFPFWDPESEMDESPWANLANIIDLLSYGNYLFVTFGAGQLRVIDVSDPANPEEVNDFELGGFVIAMTLRGDTLYVTKSGNEAVTVQLCLVDVSQPESPRLMDSVDTESMFGFGGASMAYMWWCPLIIGDYIYIPGVNYMDIVEVR